MLSPPGMHDDRVDNSQQLTLNADMKKREKEREGKHYKLIAGLDNKKTLCE
jgi:hypothetical protein